MNSYFDISPCYLYPACSLRFNIFSSSVPDEYSREPSKFVPGEGEEQPIEPISHIDIGHVNDLMFGQT